MHRFLVSAAHKSSGKTTLAIGLAAVLRERGLTVQPFKKGPDYIDPIWLARAAGKPCTNLDFFLSSNDEIVAEYHRRGHGADVRLVEGNKGLYDGLDLHGSNSNAALARLLDLPVVLVLDARGMTRGIAPLILGYQAFDPELHIAGVILNRLGGHRHEAKLRAVIEHYTDVPVLGAVQEDARLRLVERHLGLMPANEAADADVRIADIADVVREQVDIDILLRLTHTALRTPTPLPPAAIDAPRVRVAIARDRAFGFYYADDLDALRRAGAELCFFDTLRDARLPDCDALLIGGGFPESFLPELSANATLREDIRAAIAGGLPTYAECGGLMYLARSIRDAAGRAYPMVGTIPGDVAMHARPVGRGYVVLQPTAAHPWRGGVASGTDAGSDFRAGQPALHAHEFHYSAIEHLPADTTYAYAVKRGHGLDGKNDGIVIGNLLASYTHLRATAGCEWPAKFLAFARRVRSPASSGEPASCSR